MAYVLEYTYAIGVVSMENTKINLTTNESRVNKIENLISNSSLEDALELNIRTYEEALANDQVELIAYCLHFFGVIEDKKAEPQKAMSFIRKQQS